MKNKSDPKNSVASNKVMWRIIVLNLMNKVLKRKKGCNLKGSRKSRKIYNSIFFGSKLKLKSASSHVIQRIHLSLLVKFNLQQNRIHIIYRSHKWHKAQTSFPTVYPSCNECDIPHDHLYSIGVSRVAGSTRVSPAADNARIQWTLLIAPM